VIITLGTLGGELIISIKGKEMDTSNSLYYLRYSMDGKFKETDELVSLDTAHREKLEFESDGAKNVEILPYRHVIK